MPSAGDIGTGATVATSTSAFTANYTNISWGGISRPSIKSSHLGTTGYDTFVIGDLTDPGEVTLEVFYNTAILPPVRGVAETWTITAPVSTGMMTGDAYSASMAMTNFEFGIPLEEMITATLTLKVLGTITLTTQTT